MFSKFARSLLDPLSACRCFTNHDSSAALGATGGAPYTLSVCWEQREERHAPCLSLAVSCATGLMNVTRGQQTRELIIALGPSHKHNNKDPSRPRYKLHAM